MIATLKRLWCWLSGRSPVTDQEYEQVARRSAEVRAYIERARDETRATTRIDRERHDAT